MISRTSLPIPPPPATGKHSLLPESPSSYVPSPTSLFHPRETCSPIVSPTKPEHSELGSALGPDWHNELRMKGSRFDEVCEYAMRQSQAYLPKVSCLII